MSPASSAETFCEKASGLAKIAAPARGSALFEVQSGRQGDKETGRPILSSATMPRTFAMIGPEAQLYLRALTVVSTFLAFSSVVTAGQKQRSTRPSRSRPPSSRHGVEPGETQPSDAEAKSLVGKTITLAAHAVDGPGSFPCKIRNTRFKGGADILFKGPSAR